MRNQPTGKLRNTSQQPTKTGSGPPGKRRRDPKVWVRHLIHDSDEGKYYLDLRFRKIGGEIGKLQVPRASVYTPTQLVKDLSDAGALLPPDAQAAANLVKEAALTEPTHGTIMTTGRGGWRDGSFISRGWTEGASAQAVRFVGGTEVDPILGLKQGDLRAWLEGLREPCAASDFLCLALGVVFGAPLLDLIGEDEGVTFNMHGESTGGKSLAGRVLQSAFGRARKSDLATYDISDRGLADLCASRNDLAVVLDEKGRNKAGREQIRSIAFTIAGGRGRILSQKAVRDLGLPNQTWRTFAMTSSEEPLENASQIRAQGERVRHIDIKVPDRKEGGIFNQLKGNREEKAKEAARLAAQVEATIEAHFGVALRPYIKALVAQRELLKPEVKKIVSEFITDAGADTDAWERRFATKSGIVTAGLILAARFGSAPVNEGEARRIIMRVYRLARQSVFSTQEIANDVLQRIRRKLDDTRFPKVEKGEALPSQLREKAWGFRRTHPQHGPIIAVDPERFERMSGSMTASEAILDHLVERGIAVPGVGGKRRVQIAVQGFDRIGRSRWVCLRAGAL